MLLLRPRHTWFAGATRPASALARSGRRSALPARTLLALAARVVAASSRRRRGRVARLHLLSLGRAALLIVVLEQLVVQRSVGQALQRQRAR